MPQPNDECNQKNIYIDWYSDTAVWWQSKTQINFLKTAEEPSTRYSCKGSWTYMCTNKQTNDLLFIY